MKVSGTRETREMYESSAVAYSKMMDEEIKLPLYADILGRLQKRIANIPGTLIDTACGSGHMLSMYHEQYDEKRNLLGVDLSPRMISIAKKNMGSEDCTWHFIAGDMRELSMVDSNTAAGLLNFFSVHHLDPEGVQKALIEWYRVLKPGGQLIVAAWEGTGAIDYGDEAEIFALRYRKDELSLWSEKAGFNISRCVVEPVEGFPMDAVYLEGAKD